MYYLIKKAQKGDVDAFTQLIEEHLQMLYKTAKTILRSDEDVADAVQETILCCWQKLGQLKKPSAFRAWITRILINKCNDLIRTRQKVSLYDEVPDMAVMSDEFDNVEWNEALREIDEKYRLVIMLYYVEGFKTGEISQILEVPEATVRTRLSRARKKVAEIYQIPIQEN